MMNILCDEQIWTFFVKSIPFVKSPKNPYLFLIISFYTNWGGEVENNKGNQAHAFSSSCDDDVSVE